MFKSRYYRNCSELPLSSFIELLDSGNLKNLVISGRPKKSTLDKVWKSIFEEYQMLMGSKSDIMLLRQFKNVYSLKFKIDMLSNSLISLGIGGYHAETIKFLNQNGIRTTIKRTTFVDDFRRAQSEIKSMYIHLKQVESQLEAMTETKHNVREDFTRILLQLSKFLGYNYSKSHTVFEFTVAVKEMQKFITEQNKQHGKRA